jgi:hypothetical protein
MDWLFVNMDFLFKHLAPWPRIMPAPFAVQSIGYLARKSEDVRRVFNTCNFSFILRGKGFYRRGRQSWEVRSPVVIIQIPGEDLHYGPGPSASWQNLCKSLHFDKKMTASNCYLRPTKSSNLQLMHSVDHNSMDQPVLSPLKRATLQT